MANENRFDLEQNIMSCWNVVEDLNLLLEQGTVDTDTVKAVATLYEQKFQYLWENFENCCANKFGYFPELPNTLREESRQTYGVSEEFDTCEDIGFPNKKEVDNV